MFLDGGIKGTLPGEEEDEPTGATRISTETKRTKADDDDEENDED
jgi:hypothetical protein